MSRSSSLGSWAPLFTFFLGGIVITHQDIKICNLRPCFPSRTFTENEQDYPPPMRCVLENKNMSFWKLGKCNKMKEINV